MRAALAAMFLVGSFAPAWSACAPDTVELRGDWGSLKFSVELADTPDERAQGLMYRESMARGSGMLFIYEQPQNATFWMKNTLIPLDMIFVDEMGVVTHVHDRAVPGDLTTIDGGDGVLAVLEINGGLAERYGIEPGSQLRHPAFGPGAAWPCGE